MRHATARRFLLACVAAAAFMSGLIGTASAAEPTALTGSASAQQGGLSVVGTLTSNGAPVPNATVDVAVDSTPAVSATTDAGGAFTADVPVSDLTVAHTVQLSFVGTADLTASSFEVAFTPAPADTRVATTVSASVPDPTLYPGELITITGSLEGAGSPVANGKIQAYVAGEEQAESLTFTDDNGGFTTYAEVPADTPPGEAALRVAHPGGSTTLPSEQSITLTIQQEDPKPTGDAETPSPEPTPTEAETTPASQPPTEAEATPSPTSSAQTTEPTEAEASPFSWFWIGALVAGGSAALVTIALLMRRAATREEKRERAEGIEPLYLLADEADADYEPEDHGWVTEEFFLDEDVNEVLLEHPGDAREPRDTGDAPGTGDGASGAAAGHPADPNHDEPAGETTQPFPAPVSPARHSEEPTPELYRTDEAPPEQPKPRRSWSGEE